MAGFIEVLGDDPHYKGRKTSMYVAAGSIRLVCPIFAEKGPDGSYYRCTPEHEHAEVVSYQVTDFDGVTYECREEDLEPLGIKQPKPNPLGYHVVHIRESQGDH